MSGGLADDILKAAKGVYAKLGPGLSEVVYQNALCIDLGAGLHSCEHERVLPVFYYGHYVGNARPGLVVNGVAVIEIKALAKLDESHATQVRASLRWLPECVDAPNEPRFGLVINFGPNAVEVCHVEAPAVDPSLTFLE